MSGNINPTHDYSVALEASQQAAVEFGAGFDIYRYAGGINALEPAQAQMVVLWIHQGMTMASALSIAEGRYKHLFRELGGIGIPPGINFQPLLQDMVRAGQRSIASSQPEPTKSTKRRPPPAVDRERSVLIVAGILFFFVVAVVVLILVANAVTPSAEKPAPKAPAQQPSSSTSNKATNRPGTSFNPDIPFVPLPTKPLFNFEGGQKTR